MSLLASVKRALGNDSKASHGCVSMTSLLNRELEGAKTCFNWHLSTGQLSTLYPFQLQTPLHCVSPLPHLFTPFYHQSQFTICIVPLVGGRQRLLKPRSVLLRVPNGPSLTSGPLQSTVQEFLSQPRQASSPRSVPKTEGRTDRMLGIHSKIQMLNTPNPDIRGPVTGRL